MSQKEKILALMRESPNHQVTCGELAPLGLYHRGAARVHELRKEGFVIEFFHKDNWNESYYKFISEPFVVEPNGQLRFVA